MVLCVLDARFRGHDSRARMAILTLDQAEALVVAALRRARTSESNARSVARALVLAEADGLKGHGLSRVPMYAAQAKVGRSMARRSRR
jgi:(2R)-3-sulfolactate dehydrogenase (NADP+)